MSEETKLSGFNKIREKCETDGYAEGLSDGRDSVYQTGFDAGYRDSFEFAFKLGQKKARQPEIEKTTRGLCLICVQPETLKKDVEEVSERQRCHHHENSDLL